MQHNQDERLSICVCLVMFLWRFHYRYIITSHGTVRSNEEMINNLQHLRVSPAEGHYIKLAEWVIHSYEHANTTSGILK